MHQRGDFCISRGVMHQSLRLLDTAIWRVVGYLPVGYKADWTAVIRYDGGGNVTKSVAP